jgi:CRISPR-associated protein Csm3
LSGVLRCVTGLHIGGNQDVADIGGVDLLVIRDPLSREPYIPGSSLKGKLRSLLERFYYAQDPDTYGFTRVMRVGEEIRHHECSRESCVICRFFGTSKGEGVPENRPALLYVRDAYLTPASKARLEQMESGYYLSEVKFENTLDRITSAANPRQVERVPRDTEFSFSLVYNPDAALGVLSTREDLKGLFTALLLLTDDYLGGHGSRGYGQVEVKGLSLAWRAPSYYLGEGQEKFLPYQEEGVPAFGARALQWLGELEAGDTV